MKKLLTFLTLLTLFFTTAGATIVTFTSAEDANGTTIVKDGVTIICSASSKSYFQCYKGASMVIESESNITNIELTCTANGASQYGPGCFGQVTPGTYSYSGKIGTWTGNSNSIRFTTKNASGSNTDQVRMTKIVVTLDDGGTSTCKKPTFSPAGGFYDKTQQVTISCETEGASILFSTDGTNFSPYNGAITVSETTHLYAKAIKENDESDVADAEYTFPKTHNFPPAYTEGFSSGFGDFYTKTEVDPGFDVWSTGSFNGTYYAKATAYKSGSANASESWLISPYLNISSTSNPQLTFSQAINFTFEDANGTLWIREKDGDWEQVTITYPTRPSSGYSEFVVQSIELSAYKGKTIQIAFKYVSTDDAAGTWEISNFKIENAGVYNVYREIKTNGNVSEAGGWLGDWTCANDYNGSSNYNVTPTSGETVTFKAGTNPGYQLRQGNITAVDENNNPVALTSNWEVNDGKIEFSFVMPASNVTITANFTDYRGTLRLAGHFNGRTGSNWVNDAAGPQFTYNETNDEYSIDAYFVGADDNGACDYFFLFLDNEAKHPSAGTYYGIGNVDGTEMDFNLGGGETNNFRIEPGVYNIKINAAFNKLSVTKIEDPAITFKPAAGEVLAGTEVSAASTLTGIIEDIQETDDYALGEVSVQVSTDNKTFSNNVAINEATTVYGKASIGNIVYTATADYTIKEVTGDVYTLVESATDLDATSEYVLFPKGSNNQTGRVMSTNRQANNIKGSETESTVMNKQIIVPGDAQTITLESTTATVDGDSQDAWFLNVGDGYLYAASSSSNHMKVSDNADDKCKATISISGNAEIIFRGDYSHRYLRYNTNDNLYSCYESGKQAPVYLYKKGASSATSAKPTISPASGNIKGGKVSVTITAAEGATIYYTKDGTDPDTESDVYTEGFDLTGAAGSSKTVKAIAVETGKEASAIATATYTFIAPSKPTFSPESGTSQESSISVTISSSDEGTIYYMVDPETAPTAGGTIVDNGTEYNGAITLSEVGDHTIYATVLLNDITSSVASATYTITSSGTQVEEKTLAQIETLGTAAVGNTYTITDALVAVYANEDILWCKDQATSIAAFNNPDPETYIDYMQVFGDAAEAQQNNWVALKFTGATQAQLDAVYRAVGSTIDAGTVTGKVIDGVNYTIEVSNMELTTTDGGNAAKNTYCPANFLQENLFGQATGHTENTSDKKYFFVNPKIQEVCEVTFAMWNGDYFVVPAANGISNDSEIPGAFNVDWKYNDKNDVSSSISQNTVYRFNAVVQKPVSSPAVEGDYVKVTSNTDLTDGNYLIVVESEGEGRNYAFVFDGSLNPLDAVSNNLSDDDLGYDIVNNAIESTQEIDNAVFTIDVEAGTIKSASGYYIYMNSNDNGLMQSATVPDNANAISIDSDGNADIVCSSAHLRYNGDPTQDRFRYYKAASYTKQSAIALYKKNVKATAPRLKANNLDAPMTGVTPDGSYMVYPLNFDPNDAENNIVTSINTVDVTGKAVKSVKYVNVAGMVSDVPFQGVNIVVTEYSDGSRSTSKMLRK